MPARTVTPADTPWLTKRESARYLRISVETLDRWQKEGIVTYHKVAGLQSVRCHREELDAIHRPVLPLGESHVNDPAPTDGLT